MLKSWAIPSKARVAIRFILIVLMAALATTAISPPAYSSQTASIGGDTGAQLNFDIDCGTDRVMTGITVNHSSSTVGKVRAVCRQISRNGAWTGSATFTNWSPTNVSGSYANNTTSSCPQDLVVSGVRGRTTDHSTAIEVDAVQIYCRAITGDGFLQGGSQAMEWIGGSGVQTTTKSCSSNYPARALVGKSKTYLHKLALDCDQLRVLQTDVPAPYASLCTQGCGSNSVCVSDCKRDYDVFTAHMGQMGSGVAMYGLPSRYVEALDPLYPGVNLANWRFGYSPRQPANNATTDCDKSYFNDQGMVGAMRNATVAGDGKIKWMLHEIAHYEQCMSWGGRYNYIHRWWTEERAAQGGNFDIWEIHDSMPMEQAAETTAKGNVDELGACCLGGPVSRSTINKPLRITRLDGTLRHSLPRSGTLEFELSVSLSSGPADAYVEWKLDNNPVGTLSWATPLDNGRRLKITNPPAGRYTIVAEARYVGRKFLQARLSGSQLIIDPAR